MPAVGAVLRRWGSVSSVLTRGPAVWQRKMSFDNRGLM
jgi:hypothetical protein